MTQLPGIICQRCGKAAPRRTPGHQKYCVPCSNTRNLERTGNRERLSQARSATAARGIEISKTATGNIGDVLREIDLAWLVRVQIPFDWAASKNHIYAMRNQGHVALRSAAAAYRDMIGWRIKEALAGKVIKNNKIWIDIFIQKPNQRGDAVNFVDLICDAVKRVIGVDDRWYSLRRVDWEIAKDNPRIFIGIGQEDVEDAIACSSCGRILPKSAFPLNRNKEIGVSRNCKECRRTR